MDDNFLNAEMQKQTELAVFSIFYLDSLSTYRLLHKEFKKLNEIEWIDYRKNKP